MKRKQHLSQKQTNINDDMKGGMSCQLKGSFLCGVEHINQKFEYN